MTKIFNKAFTLIEIIIVIVVIGVLATALIPRVKGMQEKARLMRLERDYQDLRTAVFVAQSNTKKTLMQITGDTFTSRYCTNGSPNWDFLPDLRNLPYNHLCRSRRRLALEKIAVAAGMSSGALLSMELDPGGYPYGLDENESSTCSRNDSIFSAGPDGVIGSEPGSNMEMNIPPFSCPGGH